MEGRREQPQRPGLRPEPGAPRSHPRPRPPIPTGDGAARACRVCLAGGLERCHVRVEDLERGFAAACAGGQRLHRVHGARVPRPQHGAPRVQALLKVYLPPPGASCGGRGRPRHTGGHMICSAPSYACNRAGVTFAPGAPLLGTFLEMAALTPAHASQHKPPHASSQPPPRPHAPLGCVAATVRPRSQAPHWRPAPCMPVCRARPGLRPEALDRRAGARLGCLIVPCPAEDIAQVVLGAGCARVLGAELPCQNLQRLHEQGCPQAGLGQAPGSCSRSHASTACKQARRCSGGARLRQHKLCLQSTPRPSAAMGSTAGPGTACSARPLMHRIIAERHRGRCWEARASSQARSRAASERVPRHGASAPATAAFSPLRAPCGKCRTATGCCWQPRRECPRRPSPSRPSVWLP